jgi:hypothetical protein
MLEGLLVVSHPTQMRRAPGPRYRRYAVGFIRPLSIQRFRRFANTGYSGLPLGTYSLPPSYPVATTRGRAFSSTNALYVAVLTVSSSPPAEPWVIGQPSTLTSTHPSELRRLPQLGLHPIAPSGRIPFERKTRKSCVTSASIFPSVRLNAARRSYVTSMARTNAFPTAIRSAVVAVRPPQPVIISRIRMADGVSRGIAQSLHFPPKLHTTCSRGQVFHVSSPRTSELGVRSSTFNLSGSSSSGAADRSDGVAGQCPAKPSAPRGRHEVRMAGIG